MTAITFDSLGYAKKLEEAGFTRQQAEVQAVVLREQLDEQNHTFQKIIEAYDESSRKDLATKGDVQNVRLEIEKVRAELKTDIKSLELRLLKWQFCIGLALAAIMAKGFGWIGC